MGFSNLPFAKELDIVEIYDYFDKPVFFACQDGTGSLYLAILADGDDAVGTETWYILPISSQRFSLVRSGDIELKDAFRNAENGIVYDIVIDAEGRVRDHYLRASDELPDELLPQPGQRLQLEEKPEHRDLQLIAQQTNREVLALALAFPNIRRWAAPPTVLSDVISHFQTLVTQVGNSMYERDANLLVTGFRPGSFEVEFQTTEPTGLFEPDEITEVLTSVFELLSVSSDADGLVKRMSELEVQISDAYLEFLKTVSGRVSSTRVNWASRRPDYGGFVSLEDRMVAQAVETINAAADVDSNTFPVVGTLHGINLRTGYFLIVSDSGEGYSGYSDDSARSSEAFQTAQVNRRYQASISQNIYSNPATGTSRTENILLNLTREP